MAKQNGPKYDTASDLLARAAVQLDKIENGLVDVIGNAPFRNGLTDAVGAPSSFQGNSIAGMGTSTESVSDTTTMFTNLRWYLISNFPQVLSQGYAEIGLIQVVTNVPVDDALRGGRTYKSKQLDEEQLKQLHLEMKRQDDLGRLGWAAKWTRLFGGGGVLILIDDQDPESELDLAAIGPDTKIEFRAVDMWELFWDKQNLESYDLGLDDIDFEFYSYYGENVHRSRVLTLKGVEAPSFLRPRLRGWGLSVVESVVRGLNQYLKATDLTFEVMDEFKLDIFKMKDLINTLQSPNGTNKVKSRVQLANWQKNYQNAMVMDKDDDFDHKQLSFAGLAEVQAGVRMQIASELRMPVIKIFGQSMSAGLGNSAQDEMENYNAMVESEVRAKVEFHYDEMVKIRCQQLFGMIPDDLEGEWRPLRELTALDQENVKTQKYQRVQQAKSAGELTTKEFRDASNKGGLFDINLDTDEDQLDGEEDDQLAEVLEGKQTPQGQADVDRENEGANEPDGELEPTKVKAVNAYTRVQKMARIFNSAAFDWASYEADGGDDAIEDGRKPFVDEASANDKDLYRRCNEEAASQGLTTTSWKFTAWLYQKFGGTFL